MLDLSAPLVGLVRGVGPSASIVVPRKDGGEVHVRKADGSRYVPTQWAVGLLKKDVNAWDAAIAAWRTPNEGVAVSGYDRIIAEAGPEYTWEGILIDPSRPWAAELRSKHPEVCLLYTSPSPRDRS